MNPSNAESHIEEGRKRYRAGCRCEVCKAAWAAYHRNRRARQAPSSSAPDIAYTALERLREWANQGVAEPPRMSEEQRGSLFGYCAAKDEVAEILKSLDGDE